MLDELDLLNDANNGDRATRLLQGIRRSRRRRGAIEEVERPLVEWLTEQLVASRRGAQTVVATTDAIAPTREPDSFQEIGTSYSSENKLYRVFREYSGKSSPSELTEWVDVAVRALEHLADEGWSGLRKEEQSTIDREVEPLLCRIREAGTHPVRDRTLPLPHD